mgnify:CR=1 FL=1
MSDSPMGRGAEPPPTEGRSFFAMLPRRGSYSSDVLETFATNLLLSALGLLTAVLLARLLGRSGCPLHYPDK